MWVVDTGRVETFVNPRRVCRPKLVIFDLNNHDNVYGNLFKFTIIYVYYFINRIKFYLKNFFISIHAKRKKH